MIYNFWRNFYLFGEKIIFGEILLILVNLDSICTHKFSYRKFKRTEQLKHILNIIFTQA